MAAHKAKRLKLTCGGAGVTRTSSTEPSPGMSKGRLLKKRVLEMETRISRGKLRPELIETDEDDDNDSDGDDSDDSELDEEVAYLMGRFIGSGNAKGDTAKVMEEKDPNTVGGNQDSARGDGNRRPSSPPPSFDHTSFSSGPGTFIDHANRTEDGAPCTPSGNDAATTRGTKPTSPDQRRLEELTTNNSVLRSHNLSMASQNRQLRDQVDRLRREREADGHRWRVEVKALRLETCTLAAEIDRLRHHNAILEECGVEWARVEAVLAAQVREWRARYAAVVVATASVSPGSG